MDGSLNDILLEPVSAANEKALLNLLKLKVEVAARISVQLLQAMEERFGPTAREVLRDMVENYSLSPRPESGDPEVDLHEFCDHLEQDCVGSHRWERIVDEPDRIGYRFTRCVWAEVFRELGEPELGRLLCAGDEPAVRSYNPQLAFSRTRVLMDGDEFCDHVFYVEEPPRLE